MCCSGPRRVPSVALVVACWVIGDGDPPRAGVESGSLFNRGQILPPGPAPLARALAGLGPGPTPSGDDVLAGCVAGLVLLHGLRKRATRVAEEAAARTNSLSATLLRHAALGEVPEPVHILLATERGWPLPPSAILQGRLGFCGPVSAGYVVEADGLDDSGARFGRGSSLMRIVVALGGNALLRRGEPMEASIQREHVEAAARAVASIAREHEVVLTHGNGPQIGLLALQSEAYHAVHPYPLDVLGAESEGMIGYLLQQALGNELPGRDIATVLTEVLVDVEDSAFGRPTKPVGPIYTKNASAQISLERGWDVAPDGRGYRRVVASPQPREIVQIDTIRRLVEAGVTVICSGGGGIPTGLGQEVREAGWDRSGH